MSAMTHAGPTSSSSAPGWPASAPPATWPPAERRSRCSRRATGSAAGWSRSSCPTGASCSSAARSSATATPPTSGWWRSSGSPWCRRTSRSRARSPARCPARSTSATGRRGSPTPTSRPHEKVEARPRRKVVRGDRPGDPCTRTPSCDRLDRLSVGDWLREVGATPAVLRAQGARHLGLADGSVERTSMFAYARKTPSAAARGSYDVRGVGEPAGGRGVGHRRADDGGGAAPTYGCPRRSPQIAVERAGVRVTHADRASCSTPTPWCSPCPPARRATSRSPASARRGSPRCAGSGTRGRPSSWRRTTSRSGGPPGRTRCRSARA